MTHAPEKKPITIDDLCDLAEQVLRSLQKTRAAIRRANATLDKRGLPKVKEARQ